MSETTIHHTYDAAKNVVFVTFPKVHLETRAQIKTHSDATLAFWRANCRGKKVYYVIDYDGFSINMREDVYYAEQLKRTLPTAITVVRYGGDPLQRTAARLSSMKLHSPARLYDSREEALAVVEALKAGEMKLEGAP